MTGDVGEFWNDVKEARRAAGLPARRGTKPSAQQVSRSDAKKFRTVGLVQKSEWHWQMTLAGDALDFWPSRRKWRWRGQTQAGSWQSLLSLIYAQRHATGVLA